jgi:hypothetical protein
MIFACIILVLIMALSPIILKSNAIAITASVPIAVGSGGEPRFEVQVGGANSHEIRYAFVDEAQGTLRLETTNWVFIFISNLSKLLTAIMLAYVFYLLRNVFQSVETTSPFTQENCDRIRRLGYMVLLVGILRPTLEYIAANEILNQLSIIEPALSLPSPFKAEAILASLLILIIAQIWGYGLELERDQALTV